MAQPRLVTSTQVVTPRQWEVAELVALGYSNAEIGRELGVSVAGAKYHVAELLRRLGLRDRNQVAAWYRDERIRRNDEPHLIEAAARRGWPDDLMPRALGIGMPRQRLRAWLRSGLAHERVASQLEATERVLLGELRVRIADTDDVDRLADLYEHAPQDIDGWQVTVRRAPYAFAQLRLQEHPYVQLVEEHGTVHASAFNSVRETIVGGRRVTVSFRYAARVRAESRGHGFGALSHWLPPADAPGAYGRYFFIRERDHHRIDWLRSLAPAAASLQAADAGGMPGLTVEVVRLAPPPGRMTGRSRPVRRSDVRQCVRLINRTHQGLDLFRPYTVEFLERRLDDGHWGPKSASWVPVYGWSDYRVIERDGRVVACGGLWDRGRDIQEVWRSPTSTTPCVMADGALMDFGFAEGDEDAMGDLIAELAAMSVGRGRTRLLAPLQWLPGVLERLVPLDPRPQRRRLVWHLLDEDASVRDPGIRRPYVDLAYWA